MIKKLQLFCLTLLGSVVLNAQTAQPPATCGTQAPPQQWEDWMDKEVEKFKQDLGLNKTQQVMYTIPVIVHIVHFGEAVGTFPNIDSSIVRLQINSLNADFAGSGYHSGSIPTQFAGFKAGNTGITFCRATKNPNGSVLPEVGIDRVNAQLHSWQNPNTPTLNLQAYMDNTIKPATIWDPTKYYNIWISDRPSTVTLNGYSTYPGSTSLTGIIGGTVGTTLNDGSWCYTKAFGPTGTGAVAPYDYGRTLTHEVGHYLGLRHIWGDGNCLSDYCGDTPPAKQPNYGHPTFPAYIDRCGTGQSSYGEMFMNFMDMTDDTVKSMFTQGQFLRMQVALSQCPNRNLLGTHGLCQAYSAPSQSAIPSFSMNGMPCVNQPFTPYNTSNGYPEPTYIWSASPPVTFSPNPTVANPAIIFNTPGTYTLTLVATNTVSNGSFSMAVTANTCGTTYACIDTLRLIKNVDSLITYKASNSTVVAGCLNGFAGYMTGTNCYKDKEYAQYYPPSSYTNVPFPEVNSVIVLFDTYGTKLGSTVGSAGASQVSCKIYGGSVNNGPVSVIAMKQDSLAYIVNTTPTISISYVGNPSVLMSSARIIPYKFNFGPPAIINSPGSGFFAAVEVPMIYAGDSIRIFGNTRYNTSVNDSSSWALTYNNIWRPLKSYRASKIQLAILPQITCSPINGIEEKTMFNSNINVVPNPNAGNFNLIFTLPKEQDLYVRIYNAVGQELSNSILKSVSNQVLNVDLSNKPAGIYFTEISNGTERVMKKVVVDH